MITQESLKEGFTWEYEANQMFPGLSPKAQKRWAGTIGSLFLAVVEAETNQASQPLPSWKSVCEGDTSAGELCGLKVMYSDFMAEAKKEGYQGDEFH